MDEKKNEKKCAKCKQVKPLDHFHVNKQNLDGRHSFCKICRREYFKPLNKKNQDSILNNIIGRVQNEI